MMNRRFDLDFVVRTIKTTGVVLLISFIFGLYYFGFYPALAFLSGGVWGIINLYLIMNLVRSTLRPEGVDTRTALFTAFVKFPLLYSSGFFLMKIDEFGIKFLLAGFTVVLAVMVLKALGRLLLGLDDVGHNDNLQKAVKS